MSRSQIVDFALVAIICIFVYTLLSLHVVNRDDTLLLFSSFVILGILLFKLQKVGVKLFYIIVVGLIFRSVFIYYIPSLSQDFYRFIWDGSLQLLGKNPYLFKPDDIIGTIDFPLSNTIYEAMGSLSARNYSNYPPVSQWIYRIASHFNNGYILHPILILRSFALLGDVLVVYFGIKILKLLKQPESLIGWYILNPLVIIELFGNLHGEGLMIGLGLGGMYFAFRNRLLLAGIFFGLAISTKLLPLLLVPLFFKYLTMKQRLWFFPTCAIITIMPWLWYLDMNLISNYSSTIRLWFVNFEFNASLHYLAREIHYLFYDFNIIRRVGKFTPFLVLTIVTIGTLAPKNKTPSGLMKSGLLVLTLYFFITTTVHPWYIISLLVLGIPLGYFYTVIWSLTVLWSYWAYGENGFNENFYIIGTEYILVYACFIYEMFKGPILLKFSFLSEKLKSNSDPSPNELEFVY